jgi:hypothetical protein
VTRVPPAIEPELGLIESTRGAGTGVSVGDTGGVAVGVFVGVTVDVLVGELVGAAVAVFVGVSVGVNVGPPGVIVGVPVGVILGVFVGVGVGVAPVLTATVRTALLFDISASAWFPITPATTERFPVCRGVAAMVTLEAPVAGHMTVVEGSFPPGTRRQGPAVEFPELIVTAGEKIAVTHTPLPPAEFT